MPKLLNYFKESKQEMKKVVWPSKKETTNYTLAVIFISLGLAAFFAIVDYFLNLGLEKLINK
ncbi:preprotein translocase subunit SecE [Candidatus Uhrbacteria bacterium RIFCSPLOWO2_01_FULL_47_24]|uniref:Protein translocase subunit SecE n=1 Tax=Candidatus Uhrbacteria bacterium RIFCSPLOWO2_01_FULL_47_24 TaxID=1802401 RepID=A0A1F7UPA1_9BACT|nr:MAG: preprotein translocase subunit SecE [Candidatus Uhrbacteria bacterium RIFCSPHIGHO2_01_FULL_47_11]OGL67916.1 MAG: preprotein translocase subunit SecE [Candidatus Uhrbacteria bacterium RIFCSPHIGHO2_02_FULL_46_47]OGL75187.1 MAG: preprotein translocase subunit SecE [Candidatus Uhrbacteria bacterium RIFCSPHIGHO2_12_FULL_47_11]OGL80102.1 MAG: preprotein translocase subunit SecE [Candidatus Uhrbacteria bacterium RIFCSPLOWO2_01_FULL_47_24]OGL84888.1 MAG: preprotein translocase subunit SecE [Can